MKVIVQLKHGLGSITSEERMVDAEELEEAKVAIADVFSERAGQINFARVSGRWVCIPLSSIAWLEIEE